MTNHFNYSLTVYNNQRAITVVIRMFGRDRTANTTTTQLANY